MDNTVFCLRNLNVSGDLSPMVVIETLLPGDVFGDFGLGTPVNHTARVSKTVSLCKTPKADFLALVQTHPEIIFQLMRVMARRTADYEEKIAQLCYQVNGGTKKSQYCYCK